MRFTLGRFNVRPHFYQHGDIHTILKMSIVIIQDINLFKKNIVQFHYPICFLILALGKPET